MAVGFADSFGGYLCQLVVVGAVLLFVAAKLLRTIDDDGGVRKTAKDEFAACIERLFKK